ncbi:MAG: pur operon repressor [Clostridia bacterium]|nr:pur operon repressor [Clostridia bacterium]MBQ4157435.1 pur operon repressor [Clostridia bacterium]
MERVKRNERLGAMTRILTSENNRIHTLSEFCDLFGSAKSTISEDVDLIDESLKKYDMGSVDTVAGAAGGVRYRATMSKERVRGILQDLGRKLSDPNRLLPGGFLYTSDVSSDPNVTELLGNILAMQFYEAQPDFVLTMETKGIPLALMTARAINVPLVIARRDSKAYEGSAVKINYISGAENERIETMALSRRAVTAGSRALIIDDFMKGGGTLQGMVEMMAEFQAEVVGIGVMISTAQPEEKRCKDAKSLLVLQAIDRNTGTCVVEPSKDVLVD